MANTQAIGVYSKLLICAEESERTLPTDLTGKVYNLPFNTNSLSSSQNTTQASTITGRRDPSEPLLGNIDNSGTLVVPLDTKSFGVMLAAMCGAPTTTAGDTEGLYKHVFTFGTTQPSFAMEKVFNNNIYALSKGCKVSKMSLEVGGDGELTASFDLLGCDETLEDAVLTDSPVDLGFNRLNNFQGKLYLDDTETAIATQVSAEIDTGIDTEGYAIGSNGYRTRLNEGILQISGQLTAFFDNKDFIDKALNTTKTAIKIVFTKGTHSLTIEMPETIFARKTPGIDGATGIVQELDYSAFYSDNTQGKAIIFTLVNDVASYQF